MKYIVATRRGRLNVRSGPGLNYTVIFKLNKGSIVQISETRQGWSRLTTGGWVSEQYLRAYSSPGAASPPAETTSVSSSELFFAEHKLKSYIRWRNPPQIQAGMGGIFPGESDYGRVIYPYLNWLSAYSVTVEAFLSGEPKSRAIQAWSSYLRRQSLLSESGGQYGVLKANNVWSQIPNRVREVIVNDYDDTGDIYHRVMTDLRSYRRSEIRRLNAPRDYGLVYDILGVR
ncbi:MAG: SH3 domain-containing protein [Candidatus Thiodiazotropha taylori]|nr:SH3 domain-containing protein [Candidatus Thiodiazotropha taylori]MCW4223328.1 SH3 domain-containing protein [Candidatus Thiodiazotropha endolucinida]MCG7884907.1 SH3 domain-containing protein [Candidatus Thiodiazotropha taylori]MCG7892097.1 SH3 domain-containing protein [Candidatus Thiodiazotropha taylori]MCG8032534.1 SH3 domain-containing protein [Candidatus Thiodiazotropha taylori]